MTRVAVLVRTLQPYHVARLRACTDLSVTAVEITNASRREYRALWADQDARSALRIETLFPGVPAARIPRLALWRGLFQALDRVDPEVVAIPAWGEAESLIALQWTLDRRRRSISMSESCYWDKPRRRLVERVKSRVVALFDAALAGGEPQTEYLRSLGVPAGKIFTGYDVVDNDYFLESAERIRALRLERARECGLERPFFLAASRFVPKKNLETLIRAYHLYRNGRGEDAWDLVMVGDGPLRASLARLSDSLGLNGAVKFPGMEPYARLPLYYGLASVFVHPSHIEQWGLVVNEAMASGLPVLVSSRCGCARDLVHNGVNGYRFDPRDGEQLAARMDELHRDDALRGEMSRNSRARIREWSPRRFAAGMADAARAALEGGGRGRETMDAALLSMLIVTRHWDQSV